MGHPRLLPPSEKLTRTELIKHRKRISREQSALPHRASKAFKILVGQAPAPRPTSIKARQGRRIVVRSVVKPEIAMKPLVRALIALAEHQAREEMEWRRLGDPRLSTLTTASYTDAMKEQRQSSNQEGLPRPRAEVVEQLSMLIDSIRLSHPVRVAIDGPDAAGKTTLADELAAELRLQGRQVIRASIDGFHRPRAERYRNGENSPDGYYNDSFDYKTLRRVLLEPLGVGGSREYRRAVFDFRTDAPLAEEPGLSPDDAVLLFDGIFLLRPELLDCWDLRIFVSVDFKEALRRALGP